MNRPLFKASDGGYFEMARVTEDSKKSALQYPRICQNSDTLDTHLMQDQ